MASSGWRSGAAFSLILVCGVIVRLAVAADKPAPVPSDLHIRFRTSGGQYPPVRETLEVNCKRAPAGTLTSCRTRLEVPVNGGPYVPAAGPVGSFETQTSSGRIAEALGRLKKSAQTVGKLGHSPHDAVIQAFELEGSTETPLRAAWIDPGELADPVPKPLRDAAAVLEAERERLRKEALGSPLRAATLSCSAKCRDHDLDLKCTIANVGRETLELPGLDARDIEVYRGAGNGLLEWERRAFRLDGAKAEKAFRISAGKALAFEWSGTSKEAGWCAAGNPDDRDPIVVQLDAADPEHPDSRLSAILFSGEVELR